MAEVFNQEAKKIGEMDLPARVFNRPWNPSLVHQALVAQTKNARVRVAKVKGRGEVSGGGKKPWAQKGTGRSRQGSTRSPLWKGGGVTHGPTGERNYAVKLNRKMKQGAIFSVLSKKLNEGEVKIVDSLNLENSKTKTLSALLGSFFKTRSNTLLIPGGPNRSLYLASGNLPRVKTLSPKTLNVYDLLKFKNILLDKEAVPIINDTYHVLK